MLTVELNTIIRLAVRASQIIIINRIIENEEIIDPIDEIIFQDNKRSG